MVELCTSVPPSPKRDSCNPDEQSYHGLFIRRWFWENPKCYNGWLVPQLQWLSASSDPCYLYTRYSTFFGQPLCFCLRAKAPQLRFYPISTIAYPGNGIVRWVCPLFFFPKSRFLDEAKSSAGKKKAPEISSGTHTVAKKRYVQYPYRGARLVRLFLLLMFAA